MIQTKGPRQDVRCGFAAPDGGRVGWGVRRLLTINVAVLLAVIVLLRLRRRTESRSRRDERFTVVIVLAPGVLIAPTPVGTPDLQVLNGTARQVHGADVAVIVTNGGVTARAVAFAGQQRLHVVDRHTLAVWASGSPVGALAGRPPAPQAGRALLLRRVRLIL